MELKTKEAWKKLLDDVDTLLFDCDGVLWSGSCIIPGAQEVIKYFRSKGKKVYFVSNNGLKSRAEFLQKFNKHGIEAYEEEIFCTSYVTAHYLCHVLGFKGKVYLIGTEEYAKELSLVGIPCIGQGPDMGKTGISDITKITLDPEVKAVVIALDTDVNLLKFVKASSYIKNPNILFIASEEDITMPIENKEIVFVGTGCLVECVKKAVGREPLCIGKPNEPMFEILKKK